MCVLYPLQRTCHLHFAVTLIHSFMPVAAHPHIMGLLCRSCVAFDSGQISLFDFDISLWLMLLLLGDECVFSAVSGSMAL